jgi:hypothetical protein
MRAMLDAMHTCTETAPHALTQQGKNSHVPATSSVGQVNLSGLLLDSHVVRQGNVGRRDVVVGPLAKQLDFSVHFWAERREHKMQARQQNKGQPQQQGRRWRSNAGRYDFVVGLRMAGEGTPQVRTGQNLGTNADWSSWSARDFPGLFFLFFLFVEKGPGDIVTFDPRVYKNSASFSSANPATPHGKHVEMSHKYLSVHFLPVAPVRARVIHSPNHIRECGVGCGRPPPIRVSFGGYR